MLRFRSSSSTRPSVLGNQKGMAIFEIIPVLVIFTVFLTYTYGFFGAIHSGILSSIAARNYAFETFRHRPNLKYFRSNRGPDTSTYIARYTTYDVRFHANVTPVRGGTEFSAQIRNISFVDSKNNLVNNSSSAEEYHNEDIMESIKPGVRFNQSQGVNPIWLRIQYGICMTTRCGG